MIRHTTRILAVACAASFALPATALAVPGLIHMAGRLQTAGGNPVDGQRDMTFRIYAVSVGGEPLFTETHTGVTFTAGRFDVYLGAGEGDELNGLIFDTDQSYLDITVSSADGGSSTLPRVSLAGAAYALFSDEAGHAAVADAISADGLPDVAAAVAGALVDDEELRGLLTGPQGEDGIQGEQGPAGQDCDVVRDDGAGTTTVTCGDNVVVVNDGIDGVIGADGVGCTAVPHPGGAGVIITCGDDVQVVNHGEPGDPGIQGPQGDDGDQGDDGIQGPQGDQGIQGDQGGQGIQGPQGDDGDQGIQGEIGPDGERGIPGRQGDTGLKGDDGPRGPEGPQGEQGPRGDDGDDGDDGDNGDNGVSCTVVRNDGAGKATITCGDQVVDVFDGADGDDGDDGADGADGVGGGGEYAGSTANTDGSWAFQGAVGLASGQAECGALYDGSHVCDYSEMRVLALMRELENKTYWVYNSKQNANKNCANWTYNTGHLNKASIVTGGAAALDDTQNFNVSTGQGCGGGKAVACCF